MSILRLVAAPGVIESGQILLARDGGVDDLVRLPEPALRRVRGGRVGMIFQEPMTSLNPVYRIGDQIAEAVVRHRAVPAAEARAMALAALETVGIPVMLTDPVARLTRVYESLGHRFPAHVSWNPAKASGHVVLAPPSGNTASLRRRLGACRVAVLTGWALDPGCAPRHQAEAAFPLSDHADFADLVEMVRRVSPRRVYTLHGFATEFASHLRSLGFDARALGHIEQLDLPSVSIHVPKDAPLAISRPPAEQGPPPVIASRSPRMVGDSASAPQRSCGPTSSAATA
jgi:hypothetical protein